ncbi:ionotropic receptor 93a-like isoform X2 [Tachypleus tridentatus]|uniref:ionotropic receptor 93a-like isoform X2 n=1 Tax=Tachypleus tridentatus TaxID=6853 RepID=UPI003FD26A55
MLYCISVTRHVLCDFLDSSIITGVSDVRTTIDNWATNLGNILKHERKNSYLDQMKTNDWSFNVKYMTPQNLGDIDIRYKVENLLVAVSILSCTSTTATSNAIREKAPATLHLAIYSGMCIRPPQDHAVGFPEMFPISEVVSLLMDMRFQVLDQWEDIVIIHDSTIDMHSVEVLVRGIMAPGYNVRPASVTSYYVCEDMFCPNSTTKIHDVLKPFVNKDQPRYFLVIGSETTINCTFYTAKKLKLLSVQKNWVVVAVNGELPTDMISAIDVPAEANIAIVHRQSPENSTDCPEKRNCPLDLALETYIAVVQRLISQKNLSKRFFSDDTTERVKMKRRIISEMQESLKEQKTCGACIKYIVRSTALVSPFTTEDASPSVFEQTGEWTPYSGLKMTTYLFPVLSGDFRGKPIKIGIMSRPPMANVTYNSKTGKYEAKGIAVDLIRELSKTMNFTYEWKPPVIDEHGIQGRNGRWTGLIGMLLENEIEFAAMSFYQTPERLSVVNFTYAIDENPYIMLVRRPSQDNSMLFLAPFTWDTWVCILCAVVAIGPVLNLVHRLSKYYEYHQMNDGKGLFKLLNCSWYCFGALVQQGGIHLPEAISGRVLVSFWWMFVIVTLTTYSGNLVAVLTFPKIFNPIDNVQDLISSKSYASWGVFEGEAIIEYTKNAEAGYLKELYKGMKYFSDMEKPEVLKEVRENYLVLISVKTKLLTIIEEELNRTNECHYLLANEEILREPGSMIVPQNWPYLHRFNQEIKRMVESGLLMKWRQEHYPQDNQCTTSSKPQAGDTRTITISHMLGSFYVLAIGFGASLVALIIEVSYIKCYKSNQANQNAMFERRLPISDPGLLKRSINSNQGEWQSRVYPSNSHLNLMASNNHDVPDRAKYSPPDRALQTQAFQYGDQRFQAYNTDFGTN